MLKNFVMKSIYLGMICVALPIQATVVGMSSAAPVVPGATTVYASFGSGDVIFQVRSGAPSPCYGFWLRATDAGFKNNLAVLLSVTATQAPINVYSDTSQIWTGSSLPYCLVYAISL